MGPASRLGFEVGLGGQVVPGGTDKQREFGALCLGDGVAGDRGGEAILRAQREPVSIDRRACLAEPHSELVICAPPAPAPVSKRRANIRQAWSRQAWRPSIDHPL